MITSEKVLTLILTLDRTQEKVLLGMKKRGFGQGKYNGFGGKVEAGETIEQGAKRELTEEATIEAIDMKKAAVILFTFENDPVGLQVHVFVIENFKGEPKETEEMKPEWFDYDQIPYDKMWTDDKHWFPLVINRNNFVGHFHFAQDQSTILTQNIKTIDNQIPLTSADLKYVFN